VHGDVGAVDPLEFALELLFRRIDQHGRTLAEDQSLNFDKAIHARLRNTLGVDLVDPALIEENHPEDTALFRHDATSFVTK